MTEHDLFFEAISTVEKLGPPEARNTMIAVVEARLVEHEKDRLASRNEDERLSALACKECCKIVLDSLRTLH